MRRAGCVRLLDEARGEKDDRPLELGEHPIELRGVLAELVLEELVLELAVQARRAA